MKLKKWKQESFWKEETINFKALVFTIKFHYFKILTEIISEKCIDLFLTYPKLNLSFLTENVNMTIPYSSCDVIGLSRSSSFRTVSIFTVIVLNVMLHLSDLF